MTWSIMGILKWSPGGVVAWYLPNRSTTACSCGSTVYDESKIMPSRINRPTAQGRYGINRCQGSLGPRRGGTRRAYSSKDSMGDGVLQTGSEKPGGRLAVEQGSIPPG